jgi:hypothetical protein
MPGPFPPAAAFRLHQHSTLISKNSFSPRTVIACYSVGWLRGLDLIAETVVMFDRRSRDSFARGLSSIESTTTATWSVSIGSG